MHHWYTFANELAFIVRYATSGLCLCVFVIGLFVNSAPEIIAGAAFSQDGDFTDLYSLYNFFSGRYQPALGYHNCRRLPLLWNCGWNHVDIGRTNGHGGCLPDQDQFLCQTADHAMHRHHPSANRLCLGWLRGSEQHADDGQLHPFNRAHLCLAPCGLVCDAR